MNTDKRELLERATRAYENVAACPDDRPENYSLARRYVSARMRYANAAGMSEKDADLVIRKRAEHAERYGCTDETPCQFHADMARTRAAGRTYND